MVFVKLKLMAVLLLALFTLNNSSVKANCDDCGKDESSKYIYEQLRKAVFDRLSEPLGDSRTLSKPEVARLGLLALEKEAATLEHDSQCEWTCGDGRKIFKRFLTFVTYPNIGIAVADGASIEAAVHVYLRNLFREPGCEIDTDSKIIENLTGYRIIVGGAWVDTESNSTDGEIMAGVEVRTRLKDWRVPHRTIKLHRIGTIPEGRFLDLIIDATLLSNSTIYEITDSGATGPPRLQRRATRSSNLSLALYYVPWKYRFADLGSLGALLRFQISSLESNNEIFRRLIFGIRAESRGDKARIRNSYLEIGFTANSTPGAFQLNRIVGVERVIINTGLGLISGTDLTAFVRFHGEWTIRQARQYTTNGFDTKREQTLPVYEFGIGATFDPVKLLGSFK